MMATTELDRIPETILSRSQVYELRTINTRQIADQLRTIVDTENITVGDDSLQLIAQRVKVPEQRLLRMNSLKDPDRLYEGQRLRGVEMLIPRAEVGPRLDVVDSVAQADLHAAEYLRELVEPDDDAEDQAAHQAPGRRIQPPVQRVTDPAKQQERANQRIAGCGCWSCPLNCVLKRPY